MLSLLKSSFLAHSVGVARAFPASCYAAASWLPAVEQVDFKVHLEAPFRQQLSSLAAPAPEELPQQNYKDLYDELQHAVGSKNLQGLAQLLTPKNITTDSTMAAVIFEQLLHACGRTGDIEVASALIETMKLLDMPMTPWVHKSILHAYSKRGRWDEALVHLTTQLPHELLHSFHITAIARYAVQEGRRDIAQSVFEVSRQRGLVPCEALIGCMLMAASQPGNTAGVHETWALLRQRGVAVGLQAHANRIYALCRCYNEPSAAAVKTDVVNAFEELVNMLPIYMPHPATQPKSVTDTLLKALSAVVQLGAKTGDRDFAGRALAVVEESGLQPDAGLYYSFMALASSEGCGPEALEDLLSEMMGMGITPTLTHYEMVIHGYATHGKPEEAAEALRRCEAAGHPMTTAMFNMAIYGAAVAGDLVWATRLHHDMTRRGVEVDVMTFANLFLAARNYGSDTRVFCARSRALLGENQREALKALLAERDARFAAGYSRVLGWQQDMVASGVQHTDWTLHHLLRALDRLNQVGDLMQLVDVFESQRPEDISPHSIAMRCSSRHKTMEYISQVFSLADRLRTRQSGSLSLHQYHSLLFAFFWLHRDTGRLQEVVEAMARDGLTTSPSTATYLLQIYCASREWGQALKVLDDLLADLEASGEAPGDSVWHIICRALCNRATSHDVVTEFLRRMTPTTRHRFESMYNMTTAPVEPEYVTVIEGAEEEIMAPEYQR